MFAAVVKKDSFIKKADAPAANKGNHHHHSTFLAMLWVVT